MFFKDSKKLPDELILNILNRLPLKDAISLLLVTKEMNEIIKDESIWKKFGAKNFENFAQRMQNLSRKYQKLILSGNYTLTEVEDIFTLLKLSDEQCQNELRMLSQFKSMPTNHLDRLLTTNGIIALRESLITAEEVAAMPTGDHIMRLFWDNRTIDLLRKGLITPAQVATMPTGDHVWRLLSDETISALNEGLITINQLAAMPTGDHIMRLFWDNRTIDLLRKGLITPAQVATMPTGDHVWRLLSDETISALNEGLITINQLAAMPTGDHIMRLFWDNRTIDLLRKGLITPAQVAAIKNPDDAHEFIQEILDRSKQNANPSKNLNRRFM